MRLKVVKKAEQAVAVVCAVVSPEQNGGRYSRKSQDQVENPLCLPSGPSVPLSTFQFSSSSPRPSISSSSISVGRHLAFFKSPSPKLLGAASLARMEAQGRDGGHGQSSWSYRHGQAGAGSSSSPSGTISTTYNTSSASRLSSMSTDAPALEHGIGDVLDGNPR